MQYYLIRITILFIHLVISCNNTSSFFTQEKDTPDLPTFAYNTLIEEGHVIDRVLFAPHDAATIESVLIGLIRSTQTAITGALFRLSNKKIIEELIAAHKRGVAIDIILDPEAMSASKEISKLSHAGITLALYNQKKYGTYMHHKFLIFQNTLACSQNNYTPISAIVAYGSLNLTEHGLNGNRENINFRNKHEVIDAFINEVNELKEGTDRYLLANPRAISTVEEKKSTEKKTKKKLISDTTCKKIARRITQIKKFLK